MRGIRRIARSRIWLDAELERTRGMKETLEPSPRKPTKKARTPNCVQRRRAEQRGKAGADCWLLVITLPRSRVDKADATAELVLRVGAGAGRLIA
jgi:hypothetical protein